MAKHKYIILMEPNIQVLYNMEKEMDKVFINLTINRTKEHGKTIGNMVKENTTINLSENNIAGYF